MSPRFRFVAYLLAAVLVGAALAMLLSSGGGPGNPEPLDPVGRTAW